MDSIRASEAPDTGSIPVEATFDKKWNISKQLFQPIFFEQHIG